MLMAESCLYFSFSYSASASDPLLLSSSPLRNRPPTAESSLILRVLVSTVGSLLETKWKEEESSTFPFSYFVEDSIGLQHVT